MGTFKNWIATAATAVALHTTIASAQEAPKTAEHTAHQVAVVLADATPAIQAEMTSIVVNAKAGEADLKKNLDTTTKPGQVAVTIVTPAGVTPPALDASSLGAIQVESISKTVEPTTTPVSPADSAIATVAKGYGQVLDTPFGKLSFVEIQGHEKKDEILATLKPSKQRSYNEWEGQINIQKIELEKQKAIAEVDKGTQKAIDEKLTERQVAIDGKLTERQVAIAEVDKKILTTLRGLVDIGKKIDPKYKSLIEKYATNPPPDKNAEYLLEKSQNSQIFA